MNIRMKRYESMNSPWSWVWSAMTPMGAWPSGRDEVHWGWA